ncbi:MAG: DNA alkylation repair protein [Chloroflexota bacterium]
MGATVSQIRAVVKELASSLRDVEHDELVALVEALWSVPVHERRMAAVMLLAQHADRLGVADLARLERLIRASKTWALVDAVAVDVLGTMVRADPVRVSPVMDQWATDANFWIRRSALLAELRPIRAGAALDRFVARADPMLGETEFFIRKAIGWVLREAGRRRPDEAAAWLASRTQIASGVTVREAVKYLPPADSARRMTAYREKRPAAAR